MVQTPITIIWLFNYSTSYFVFDFFDILRIAVCHFSDILLATFCSFTFTKSYVTSKVTQVPYTDVIFIGLKVLGRNLGNAGTDICFPSCSSVEANTNKRRAMVSTAKVTIKTHIADNPNTWFSRVQNYLVLKTFASFYLSGWL